MKTLKRILSGVKTLQRIISGVPEWVKSVGVWTSITLFGIRLGALDYLLYFWGWWYVTQGIIASYFYWHMRWEDRQDRLAEERRGW